MKKLIAFATAATMALSLGACTQDGRVTNDSIHVAECLINREIPLSGNLDTDLLFAETTIRRCYNEGALNARAAKHGIRILYSDNFRQPSRLYNCIMNVNVRGSRNYRQCARFFREP